MAEFTKNVRENGLVELVCSHGIGHPSSVLTNARYYYGVHGCDGCCSRQEFKEAEARWAKAQGLVPYGTTNG